MASKYRVKIPGSRGLPQLPGDRSPFPGQVQYLPQQANPNPWIFQAPVPDVANTLSGWHANEQARGQQELANLVALASASPNLQDLAGSSPGAGQAVAGALRPHYPEFAEAFAQPQTPAVNPFAAGPAPVLPGPQVSGSAAALPGGPPPIPKSIGERAADAWVRLGGVYRRPSQQGKRMEEASQWAKADYENDPAVRSARDLAHQRDHYQGEEQYGIPVKKKTEEALRGGRAATAAATSSASTNASRGAGLKFDTDNASQINANAKARAQATAEGAAAVRAEKPAVTLKDWDHEFAAERRRRDIAAGKTGATSQDRAWARLPDAEKNRLIERDIQSRLGPKPGTAKQNPEERILKLLEGI